MSKRKWIWDSNFGFIRREDESETLCYVATRKDGMIISDRLNALERDYERLRGAECPVCHGDGVARCDNPDHGFISLTGDEIGRLGCPVCGHDPEHRVKGEKCEMCDGTGSLIPPKEAET